MCLHGLPVVWILKYPRMGWGARLSPEAKQAQRIAWTRRLSQHLADEAFLQLATRHPDPQILDVLAAIRPHLDGRPKDAA